MAYRTQDDEEQNQPQDPMEEELVGPSPLKMASPTGGQTTRPQQQQTAQMPAPQTTAPAPTTGYDRQQFQDAWSSSAGHSVADLDALIKAHPEYATGITGTGDKRTMPGYVEAGTGIYRGPENLDLVGDAGGANSYGWTGYGAGSASDPANGAGAAAAGSGSSGPMGSLVHDAILKLLEQGNKPVTEEDMASQFEPVSREVDRGAMNTRRQAAERLAQGGFEGGGGGPMDAEVNSINEQAGEKKSGLMAQMMSDELKARRQQVTNALQFAQGEEKNALELQLSQIDAGLRQQQLELQGKGIDLQNQQFYDRLAFDESDKANQSDDELLNTLTQ